jgi:hypothetical protein
MTVHLYVKLQLPREHLVSWRARELLAQEDRLAGVYGYDAIDMGDDDLLGSLTTVEKQTTLEGTLAYLHEIGFPVTPSRISHWEAIESEGEPAIRFVEAGPLPRDATVADLLGYLSEASAAGREFIEIQTISEGSEIELRGMLSSYEAYRDHRLPLLYAAAAAGALGGHGQLSFGGESDGEFVVLFVDVDGDHTTISEPDPQDVYEDDWEVRLGGYELTSTLYEAWQIVHGVATGTA